MTFQVFNKRAVPPKKTPSVTIQKKGVIGFSRPAHLMMGSPEAVELLYDQDNRKVAFRRVDPEVGHAYAIRSAGNGMSFLLSGGAFTRYYEIPTDFSRRYVATMVDDMLCIDLNSDAVEVTSNRRGRPAGDAPPLPER